MTDKQIIIDGCDVSGCEHFDDSGNYNCRGCRRCEDNPNCDYKQLKRKESECEELKKSVEHWQMEHKEAKAKGEWTYDLATKRLGQQLDQLKAENEELKEYIKHLHNLCGNETDKQYEYKTTLTEIKEIAEPYQKDIDKICDNCRRYDDCHACCMDDINCYQYKKGTTPACDKFMELKDFDINKLANQILQKISEVFDESN